MWYYNTYNAMTFVHDYEKIWILSLQTISIRVYTVCFVSPPKRKKIKVQRYLARRFRERTLMRLQRMELLVVLFHVPGRSHGVLVCATQNARSVHFYWARENSQSKPQWVSSVPLLGRRCHWRERWSVLKFLIFITLSFV